MENYNGIYSVLKAKRKELEEFNDDFSEFSLSSPARKIRRLDVELPPIVEEEDTNVPMSYEQVIPSNVIVDGISDQLEIPDIEDLPPVPENKEKAIVLFKPMSTPPSYSGSTFSIDPDLIASFKNQAFWRVNVNAVQPNSKDEDLTDGEKLEESSCRAVVPWVPSQQLIFKPEVLESQAEESDAMDAEEPEVTTMEIENAGGQTSDSYRLSRVTEGMPSQWQQQHCTIPQPLENKPTPVVWYR
ncbi:uncharacterized protein LOC141597225 isoform X2 [Silene latifolia]|uniref:uncharacterized protein LOC141597225 isoform X2 n=1 Tax=Silene latifolia TaxID=37657 RepID=UPI003D77B0C0